MLRSSLAFALICLYLVSSLWFSAVCGKPLPLQDGPDYWQSEFDSVNFSAQAPVPVAANFPYFIPFDNNQTCDIYGPLCQPGSITLHTFGGSSPVTIPCSSYLSSQSIYMSQDPWRKDVAWLQRFGRSPQCRSFESMLSETRFSPKWTFSECLGTQAIGTVDANCPGGVPTQLPNNLIFPRKESCCGKCDFIVPQLRLHYFADPNAAAYCASRNRTLIPANNTEVAQMEKRSEQGHHTPKITSAPIVKPIVVNGHTLTSPTMYLEILGNLTMYDDCGMLGTPTSNALVAVPSGGLMTEEPITFSSGEVFVGPNVGLPFTDATRFNPDPVIPQFYTGAFTFKSLNVAELECPTVGVGETFLSGHTYRTIGPPWLQSILPPLIISTLQPEWSSLCAGRFPGNIVGVYDPPHVLQADSGGLIPSALPATQEAVTPTPIVASSSEPKAQAGPRPVADGPVPTSVVQGLAKPTLADDPNASQSSHGGPVANDPQIGAVNNVNSPADIAAKEMTNGVAPKSLPLPSPVIVGDPKMTVGASGIAVAGLIILPGGPAGTIPGVSISSGPYSTPDVGREPLPFNPFAGDTLANTLLSPVTVGDQTFTPAASGFAVAGTSIKPGGSAVTIAQTPISLAPSGILQIGSETISLIPSIAKVADLSSISPMTIGDQVFTPAVSGFVVGKTTVKPNGPAITIGNTPISLGPTGNFFIGSNSINLSSPSQDDPTPTVNAAGVTTRPNEFRPGAGSGDVSLVIDGKTIFAGGPATTISGMQVSLGLSGQLVVGTSTVNLATIGPIPTGIMYSSMDTGMSSNGAVETDNATSSLTVETYSGRAPAITRRALHETLIFVIVFYIFL